MLQQHCLSGSVERFPPSPAVFHVSHWVSDDKHGSLLPACPCCGRLDMESLFEAMAIGCTKWPCAISFFLGGRGSSN